MKTEYDANAAFLYPSTGELERRFFYALMLRSRGEKCLLRMFLSFRLLSPTTEKKRFCQTSAKEKRCNLKKDYNAL